MALQKGDEIYGMKVSFVLKQSDGIDTYRVRCADGLLKVLKQGTTEAERLFAPLSFLYEGRGDDYVLYRHINGETLDKRLRRLIRLDQDEAKDLALDLLRQLSVFHKEGVTYNNLVPENILIEVHGERPTAYLCGLSKLAKASGRDGNKSDNDIDPETFKKDLEGVARIIQLMLEGMVENSPVKIKVSEGVQTETLLERVMNHAFDHGFESAQDMMDALQGKEFKSVKSDKSASEKKEGKGFSVVAGMTELKEKLKSEVIDVLADKEGAKQYGIDIPNGMLLYGPPGCGKTFIAKCFAQETGYNYKYVKSSDLASVYIHGSQQKIAELFDQARAEAPTILCFDEFDALVPSRGDVNNTSLRSEVNEFLAQLDNCGKDNVFVIATTNRPDKIDSAILRTGRIDYIIYVPVPDSEARCEIFKMHISSRPHAQDLDYQTLADMTQGYVASDIAAVVQQAARQAFKSKQLITLELLKSVIAQRNPSLSKATIAEYEKLKEQFEKKNNTSNRKPIGFA